MRCQICQSKQAVIHSLDLIENQWVQRYLCEDCANEPSPKTVPDPFKAMKVFGQILSQQVIDSVSTADTSRVCPGCGMDYEAFQRLKRLGCSRCYETFQTELEQIFLKVQEQVIHKGKVPGRPDRAPPSSLDIRRLKEKLARAIEQERFEEAALFRDKIRQLAEGVEDPNP